VINIIPGQLIPLGGAPVPTEQGVGWDLELKWTFLENRKSLVPTGIQTRDSLGRSLASTLTRLSWLPVYGYSNLMFGYET